MRFLLALAFLALPLVSTAVAQTSEGPWEKPYTAEQLLIWQKDELPEAVWNLKVEDLQQHLDAGGRVPRYFLGQMREWRRAQARAQGYPLMVPSPSEASASASGENSSPARKDTSIAEASAAAVPIVKSGKTYEVPFASSGNTLTITVSNVKASALKDVRVTARDMPTWLSLKQHEVQLSRVKAGAAKAARFTFSVSNEAPVGKTATLSFDIATPAGRLLTKEIAIEVSAPEVFKLYGNYPNPFSVGTTIAYDLPEDTHVRIAIYDVLGRRVAVITDEEQEAGHREIHFEGRGLSSGLYFYRIEAGKHTDTGRMMLVK